MLQSGFLAHAARQSRFSRWLAQRQAVLLHHPAPSSQRSFISPRPLSSDRRGMYTPLYALPPTQPLDALTLFDEHGSAPNFDDETFEGAPDYLDTIVASRGDPSFNDPPPPIGDLSQDTVSAASPAVEVIQNVVSAVATPTDVGRTPPTRRTAQHMDATGTLSGRHMPDPQQSSPSGDGTAPRPMYEVGERSGSRNVVAMHPPESDRALPSTREFTPDRDTSALPTGGAAGQETGLFEPTGVVEPMPGYPLSGGAADEEQTTAPPTASSGDTAIPSTEQRVGTAVGSLPHERRDRNRAAPPPERHNARATMSTAEAPSIETPWQHARRVIRERLSSRSARPTRASSQVPQLRGTESHGYVAPPTAATPPPFLRGAMQSPDFVVPVSTVPPATLVSPTHEPGSEREDRGNTTMSVSAQSGAPSSAIASSRRTALLRSDGRMPDVRDNGPSAGETPVPEESQSVARAEQHRAQNAAATTPTIGTTVSPDLSRPISPSPESEAAEDIAASMNTPRKPTLQTEIDTTNGVLPAAEEAPINPVTSETVAANRSDADDGTAIFAVPNGRPRYDAARTVGETTTGPPSHVVLPIAMAAEPTIPNDVGSLVQPPLVEPTAPKSLSSPPLDPSSAPSAVVRVERPIDSASGVATQRSTPISPQQSPLSSATPAESQTEQQREIMSRSPEQTDLLADASMPPRAQLAATSLAHAPSPSPPLSHVASGVVGAVTIQPDRSPQEVVQKQTPTSPTDIRAAIGAWRVPTPPHVARTVTAWLTAKPRFGRAAQSAPNQSADPISAAPPSSPTIEQREADIRRHVAPAASQQPAQATDSPSATPDGTTIPPHGPTEMSHAFEQSIAEDAEPAGTEPAITALVYPSGPDRLGNSEERPASSATRLPDISVQEDVISDAPDAARIAPASIVQSSETAPIPTLPTSGQESPTRRQSAPVQPLNVEVIDGRSILPEIAGSHRVPDPASVSEATSPRGLRGESVSQIALNDLPVGQSPTAAFEQSGPELSPPYQSRPPQHAADQISPMPAPTQPPVNPSSLRIPQPVTASERSTDSPRSDSHHIFSPTNDSDVSVSGASGSALPNAPMASSRQSAVVESLPGGISTPSTQLGSGQTPGRSSVPDAITNPVVVPPLVAQPPSRPPVPRTETTHLQPFVSPDSPQGSQTRAPWTQGAVRDATTQFTPAIAAPTSPDTTTDAERPGEKPERLSEVASAEVFQSERPQPTTARRDLSGLQDESDTAAPDSVSPRDDTGISAAMLPRETPEPSVTMQTVGQAKQPAIAPYEIADESRRQRSVIGERLPESRDDAPSLPSVSHREGMTVAPTTPVLSTELHDVADAPPSEIATPASSDASRDARLSESSFTDTADRTVVTPHNPVIAAPIIESTQGASLPAHRASARPRSTNILVSLPTFDEYATSNDRAVPTLGSSDLRDPPSVAPPDSSITGRMIDVDATSAPLIAADRSDTIIPSRSVEQSHVMPKETAESRNPFPSDVVQMPSEGDGEMLAFPDESAKSGSLDSLAHPVQSAQLRNPTETGTNSPAQATDWERDANQPETRLVNSVTNDHDRSKAPEAVNVNHHDDTPRNAIAPVEGASTSASRSGTPQTVEDTVRGAMPETIQIASDAAQTLSDFGVPPLTALHQPDSLRSVESARASVEPNDAPSPDNAIDVQSVEQTTPIHEVRQARRRPIIAAPPPVHEDATTFPEPTAEERAAKINTLKRLRQMYSVEPDDAPTEIAEIADPAPTAPVPEVAVAVRPVLAAENSIMQDETPVPAQGSSPATQPEPTPGYSGGRDRAPTPLSLPESAHRFLRPLVGFDTRTVPIYRDTAADHVTTAHNADAVTDGYAVVMASSNTALDRPETLGLLAHEFTHVARRQQARFVPPIARPARPQAQTAQRSVREDRIVASLAEEALAQRVEDRVVQAARAATVHPSPPPTQAVTTPRAESPRAASAPRSPTAHERWAGLPAPWEPINDWTQHGPSGQATTPVESPGKTAAVANPEPVVQRALRERSQTGPDENDTPPNGRDAYAPEADLDALARQVYAILKDRLSVERRRMG